MQHAEALLLVDDHQTEILEADIGLDELVRADDDVHRTGRQRRDYGVGLFFCSETREQFHRYRELRHALDERVEMLLRQHGSRHQHSDLFTVHHRLESRSDGYLGLAETDVAANEPIHRLWLLHVPLGRLDGSPLVRCFLEWKRPFELPLPRCVVAELVPRLGLARGLQLEQIRGDIGDRLLGVGFSLGPAFAADDAEWWPRPASADVFADEVRLGHRHIQLGRILLRVACAVLDHEALLTAALFVRACPGRQYFQSEVAADAVLQMDYIVTHAQVCEIDLQRRSRRCSVGRLEPPRLLHAGSPKNLRVCDDDQLSRLDEEPA